MKKLMKTLAVSLAAVLTLTVLSVPVSAQSFDYDKSRVRVKSPTGTKCTLEIGDMTFEGYLGINYATDQNKYNDLVDSLIVEVLHEMGNANFEDVNSTAFRDTLGGLEKMTPGDYDLLSGAMGDKLGLSYGDMLEVLDSIDSGGGDESWYDYGTQARLDTFMASDSDVAAKLNNYMNNSGKGSGDSQLDIFDSLSDFRAAYGDWMNYLQNHPDQNVEWHEFTTREDFYTRLNDKLKEAYKENFEGYTIVFENAIDHKPYTLFGTEGTETWTLNMTLNIKPFAWDMNNPQNVKAAEFDGNYTIDINYDLTALADKLPELLQTPEWRGTGANDAWAFLENGFTLNWTLAKPGQWIVTRTLKGNATANVALGGGVCNISLEKPPSDRIDDPSVTVNMNGVYDHPDNETFNGATYKLDMVVSMDEQGFDVKYGADEAAQDIKVPGNETVLKRGNLAKEGGWKLKVLPSS